MNWIKVENKEIDVPFIPKVTDKYDLRNFDDV